MAKKQKDNLRRGKRGNVPRFDYHVVFSNGLEGVYKYINNVKDVLFLGWENMFKIDSHILNKNILRSGRVEIARKDGATMLVVRTLKHTPDEMAEMYLSADEAKLDYVDSYLSVNPGLKRKVGPLLKAMSKGAMRLRQSFDEAEAMQRLNFMPVPGIDYPVEFVASKDSNQE
jgi:hypothetical protein